MIAEKEDILRVGIFSPAEAALYARVRTQTVNRWLFGDATGAPVVLPQLPKQDEKVATFLDFVQVLAIRALRSRHKVPLEKIRQAVDLARERGVPYPFAVRHTTYLFGDQQEKGHGEVVIEVAGQLIQASGRDRRNLVMRQVAELYMRDLYFDPDTGYASEYVAWQRGEEKITMNPRRRFGEPVVLRCGYSASTLWEAYEIEGGTEAAAKAYGVDNRDVELACEYYDHLLRNSA
jgi:uncharacterized protein (DUF433 family)